MVVRALASLPADLSVGEDSVTFVGTVSERMSNTILYDQGLRADAAWDTYASMC